MKKQIDCFLLGLLWILALTLGASFWFNTHFGFNIFYIQHWGYLGRLQASSTPVSTSFYISIVVFAFLTIGGLYTIFRPKFRRIRLSTAHNPTAKDTNVSVFKKTDNSPTNMPYMRPPRPAVPKINNYMTASNATSAGEIANLQPPALTTQTAPSIRKSNAIQPEEKYDDIEQIFEKAGFLVKKPPKIGKMRLALFAIGTDEVLWVGTVGTNYRQLSDAMKRLDDVFTETLEDIKINIRAFILSPQPDDEEPDIEGIEKFDTIEDLQNYMNSNKNTPVEEYDADNFEAYSEYIDTVSNYLSKL